jgi:hypothetical protein
MDFPTSDVEIRQILTEGEAFDDVLIFGCMPPPPPLSVFVPLVEARVPVWLGRGLGAG